MLHQKKNHNLILEGSALRDHRLQMIAHIIDLGEIELKYTGSEDITYIMMIRLRKIRLKEINHKESILETCIFLNILILIIIDHG